MNTATNALTIENVSVAFGDTPVTHDVSFDVPSGSVVALVGESGSGKSVTALSLLGLVAGRVTGQAHLADGTELIGAEPHQLRQIRGKRIGMVFQEPMGAFDPVYTIGHHLREALAAHHGHASIEDQLTRVGLKDPARIARSYPHQLSGGQLQRAMIALATLHDPELLIADEPTTALDVTVQAGILDLLRDIARERAVLLITHDMGVVADVATHVVVMKDGHMVETADVTSLFSAPQHPYTRRLLDSVPRVRDRATKPTTAAGEVKEEGGNDLGEGRLAAKLTGARMEHKTTVALNNVDIQIPAHTIVGLVGESGSGKSTIANVLIGAQRLTAGSAQVVGTQVRPGASRVQRQLRARIGVVFQDPAGSLNPRRSVRAQLAQPFAVHTRLGRREIARRVDRLLEDVQLPVAFGERFPRELSGGQKQRVAIARALALEPDVLIADEPTSALDVSVQTGILELLAALHEKRRFASLFISHDLAVIGQVASEVVVLRDGAVVESGPVEQVLGAPASEYTRALLDAAPVPDPALQASRRQHRLESRGVGVR